MPKSKARTSVPAVSAKKQKDASRTIRDDPMTATVSTGVVAAASVQTLGGNLAAGAKGESVEAISRRSQEISDKIKELVLLAQEQGYLTYNDVNDALPANMVS